MKRLFCTFLVLTALRPCAAQNATTVEFSSCDLPHNILIHCRHDYEMSINGTSHVTVTKCKIDASPPFKAEGNAVMVEECVNFTVRAISDQNSKNEEEIIHYQCKPSDLPTDHTAAVIGAVLGGVLGGVGVLVLICVAVTRLRARDRPRRDDPL